MMLDIKTLMILYLITSIISAGALAIIWSQNRGRYAGVSMWLMCMILQAFGSLFIILRGLIPDSVSIVMGNTMIAAGLLVLLIGLEQFTGKKGWQIHNYILLAVYCIATYYSSVNLNLAARNIELSAVGAIITFQCCWLMFRRTDPGMRKITRLTGIVLAVYFVACLARIILTVIFPEQTNDFFKSGVLDGLVVIMTIVLGICLAISLVIMVINRLLMEVKAQEDKYTMAFHSAPYAITLVRMSDGKIFEVNDGFVRMSGYQPDEVIGKTTLDLNLWISEEERRQVINEVSMGKAVNAMETQFRKKTGEVVTALFSSSFFTINEQKYVLSTIGDITERKQIEQKLLEMATHDALTNLPNRTLLYDRFNVALANAQRNNAKLAIMSVDIDYLKTINDSLGHDVGDKLLTITASRLTAALRKGDTVARVGGDEFILLIGEIHAKEDSIKIAEKILENLRQPFLVNEHSLNVSASIGIAMFPDDGKDIEGLLIIADQNLYSAKQNGRDRYSL